MKILGKLYLSGQSKSVPAVLIWSHGSYWLKSDSKEIYRKVSIDELEIRLPVGSLPYQLFIVEGLLFEAVNNREAEGFLKLSQKPISGSWLRYLEQQKKAVFAGIAMLAILGVIISRYALPWFGDQVATRIPQTWLKMAGDETLEILDKSVFSPSELPVQEQEEFTLEFNRMASLVLKDRTAQLIFRQSERIGPNAFALPGGLVVLTDELVDISGDKDEIIGVLAHELGHVHLRHPVRRLVRSLMALTLINLILEDSATFAEELATVSGSLINLVYTREFEAEADQTGRAILIEAGLSPVPLANLLQRLSGDCEDDCSQLAGWLSTHPSVSSRIEFLLSK
jgi:Zn-dependent protease with chaperone function